MPYGLECSLSAGAVQIVAGRQVDQPSPPVDVDRGEPLERNSAPVGIEPLVSVCGAFTFRSLTMAAEGSCPRPCRPRSSIRSAIWRVWNSKCRASRWIRPHRLCQSQRWAGCIRLPQPERSKSRSTPGISQNSTSCRRARQDGSSGHGFGAPAFAGCVERRRSQSAFDDFASRPPKIRTHPLICCSEINPHRPFCQVQRTGR